MLFQFFFFFLAAYSAVIWKIISRHFFVIFCLSKQTKHSIFCISWLKNFWKKLVYFFISSSFLFPLLLVFLIKFCSVEILIQHFCFFLLFAHILSCFFFSLAVVKKNWTSNCCHKFFRRKSNVFSLVFHLLKISCNLLQF